MQKPPSLLIFVFTQTHITYLDHIESKKKCTKNQANYAEPLSHEISIPGLLVGCPSESYITDYPRSGVPF